MWNFLNPVTLNHHLVTAVRSGASLLGSMISSPAVATAVQSATTPIVQNVTTTLAQNVAPSIAQNVTTTLAQNATTSLVQNITGPVASNASALVRYVAPYVEPVVQNIAANTPAIISPATNLTVVAAKEVANNVSGKYMIFGLLGTVALAALNSLRGKKPAAEPEQSAPALPAEKDKKAVSRDEEKPMSLPPLSVMETINDAVNPVRITATPAPHVEPTSTSTSAPRVEPTATPAPRVEPMPTTTPAPVLFLQVEAKPRSIDLCHKLSLEDRKEVLAKNQAAIMAYNFAGPNFSPAALALLEQLPQEAIKEIALKIKGDKIDTVYANPLFLAGVAFKFNVAIKADGKAITEQNIAEWKAMFEASAKNKATIQPPVVATTKGHRPLPTPGAKKPS